MRLSSRRYMMLLEVMIAFALVALCILPLIYPHVAIYRAQRQFERKVQLDHAVNLLYGEVVQRLYLNRIPWDQLLHASFPVDEAMLTNAGVDPTQYSYVGNYRFTEELHKPKKPAPYSVWLLNLTFRFVPKEKTSAEPLEYEYEVFIVRDLNNAGSKIQ